MKRSGKLADVFLIRLRVFYFREGEMKTNAPFIGEEFNKRFKNGCHSLHDNRNSLITKTYPCNDKKNPMSLISLEWIK